MSAQTEPDPEQWAEAVEWLSHVDQDLRLVEMVLADDDPPLLPAALHCQQAAEKMAKAVLIALKIAPPRTHNIGALAKLIAASHVEIAERISQLDELTSWYLTSRYPDGEPSRAPAKAEISSVLEKLRALRRLVDTLAPKP